LSTRVVKTPAGCRDRAPDFLAETIALPTLSARKSTGVAEQMVELIGLLSKHTEQRRIPASSSR
jgi:hypothetical protein